MSFGDYVANVFDWNLSKEQKDGFNRAYEDALNAGIPQRAPVIFRKNGKSTLSTWHMVMRNYYLTYDTLTNILNIDKLDLAIRSVGKENIKDCPYELDTRFPLYFRIDIPCDSVKGVQHAIKIAQDKLAEIKAMKECLK